MILLLIAIGTVVSFVSVTPSTPRHVTTREAEESFKRDAEGRGGKVKTVHCVETRQDFWRCKVEFLGGRAVPGTVTWHARGRVLGTNVEM